MAGNNTIALRRIAYPARGVALQKILRAEAVAGSMVTV
jgi:hypothetical protein